MAPPPPRGPVFVASEAELQREFEAIAAVLGEGASEVWEPRIKSMERLADIVAGAPNPDATLGPGKGGGPLERPPRPSGRLLSPNPPPNPPQPLAPPRHLESK